MEPDKRPSQSSGLRHKAVQLAGVPWARLYGVPWERQPRPKTTSPERKRSNGFKTSVRVLATQAYSLSHCAAARLHVQPHQYNKPNSAVHKCHTDTPQNGLPKSPELCRPASVAGRESGAMEENRRLEAAEPQVHLRLDLGCSWTAKDCPALGVPQKHAQKNVARKSTAANSVIHCS